MKDIAIVILNYMQFINIKPGIDKLIEQGYDIDIISPFENIEDNYGYNDMFKDIYNYLKHYNYNVYDKMPDYEYKILLEPYPVVDINAKYKIRYRYGVLSAKPNKVYLPKNYLKYDAILCSGKYDEKYLSVYSKTYLTGNMKYIDFSKKKRYNKPVLLYLPTYGEESSIDGIHNYLNKLREKYHVIVKIHHGTSFLKNEIYRIALLKDCVDEFYDQYKDLSDLLELANIVLTDNSGALFEALYVKVPVAIYSENINMNKLDEFNTIQYELVEKKIIPYTNNLDEIDRIIKQACTKKIYNLQIKWSEENLYYPKDLVNDFVEVIIKHLKDDIDLRYYELHKVLKNNYYNILKQDESQKQIIFRQEKQINELKISNTEIDKLKLENESLLIKTKLLNNQLDYYRNGKLYKIAHKVYEIKNGGKNEE